ncbi:MAG: GSCFA domain-containing protein, partial [Flavisolibacter sp.]
MKFHLDLDIKKLNPSITHHSRLFLIGSCFTENIGEKLKQFKFEVFENPNGILFNPVSVAEALIACVENEKTREEDLFELNEGWHSWKHHSRFSGITAQEAVERINTSTERAHEFLKHADVVMITLGSAWVYSLSEKAARYAHGLITANNHKAPADWFHKKLLTAEMVLQVLDNMIHRLFHFNPEIRIIFTISPVRHIREGLVDNNRSKAVLIQAVHQLCGKFDRL